MLETPNPPIPVDNKSSVFTGLMNFTKLKASLVFSVIYVSVEDN